MNNTIILNKIVRFINRYDTKIFNWSNILCLDFNNISNEFTIHTITDKKFTYSINQDQFDLLYDFLYCNDNHSYTIKINNI